MAVNTEGVEAAEAANPGRHLADAAHELGAGVDVHAGALVRHALVLTAGGGGGGAGHGDAPHPVASRRGAEALRLARAPAAIRGGGGGRRATEEVEDAGGGHGGEAAEGVARGGTRRRMRRRRKRLIARERRRVEGRLLYMSWKIDKLFMFKVHLA